MNKSRRTQKQKRSSQIIHPVFLRELISLLTTSTGRKRRIFIAGVIAVVCAVAPVTSVTRGTYTPSRPFSVRVVIRVRKTALLATRKQLNNGVSIIASAVASPLIRIRQRFAWQWHIITTFIDLSQTIRGSPVIA